jgi:hypothetical protein
MTEQQILRAYIIPAMRFAEKNLYGQNKTTAQLWNEFKEQNEKLSIEEVCAIIRERIKYVSRFPWQNHCQHPGYTLWKGSGICKDVAFLLHSFLENSHYIEAWKDILDGHVFVVHSDFVYDFTSPHGLRKRHREFQDPIESVKRYYSNPLFIQENFKILKKYEGKIL